MTWQQIKYALLLVIVILVAAPGNIITLPHRHIPTPCGR